MNELTFLLAVLVKKDVLTELEAKQLKKEAAQNILNSDLPAMLAKVDRAFKVEEKELQTIDASDIIK